MEENQENIFREISKDIIATLTSDFRKSAFEFMSDSMESARNTLELLNESVRTSTGNNLSSMSFADDTSFFINTSGPNDVFEDTMTSDESGTADITKSATDNDATSFYFGQENSVLKTAINMAAKRFEKSLGHSNIRNDLLELKPVSATLLKQWNSINYI